LEADLIETVKYGTKVLTEPDKKNNSNKTPPQLYIKAMYNILSAMRDIRLFERFGFSLPVTKKERVEPTIIGLAGKQYKHGIRVNHSLPSPIPFPRKTESL
jgi:hypothetical protein